MNPKNHFPIAVLSLLTAPFAAGQAGKFTEHKLKNGPRVILSEARKSIYSISLPITSGSDERDAAPASRICSNT